MAAYQGDEHLTDENIAFLLTDADSLDEPAGTEERLMRSHTDRCPECTNRLSDAFMRLTEQFKRRGSDGNPVD